MTAQRAYELGFVNTVVPLDKLMETAVGAAQMLAEKPLASLRATKALMKKPWAAEVERAMQEEVKVLAERLTSPECREALMAFVQKRKPDFRQFR